MQLDIEIERVLQKIDFINRYKLICSNYELDIDERFKDYDNEEILKVMQKIGYIFKYNKKEDFFYNAENYGNYKIQINISFKRGIVELIWVVWKNDELLTGSPLGVLARLLSKTNERIKSPNFSDYINLEQLLSDVFVLYEDFKSEFSLND